MLLPALHHVRGGLEATCGKCLAHSPPMSGSDTAAWAELLKLGWSLYRPKHSMRTYTLCRACTTDPPNAHRRKAAAMRSRTQR